MYRKARVFQILFLISIKNNKFINLINYSFIITFKNYGFKYFVITIIYDV
jgi:hypothetical protein